MNTTMHAPGLSPGGSPYRLHRRQLGDACGFSKLSNDLFEVPLPNEFRSTYRYVFVALNRIVNERPNREWSISQGELAKMCALGKSTVERALRYLVKVKLATVVSPGGVTASGKRLTAVYRVAFSMAEADFSGGTAPEMNADFVRFWASYPRKQGRSDALTVWNALAPADELVATIITAVNDQLAYWRSIDRQFIPSPANWLRDERWEDEPKSPAASVRQPVSSGSVRPLTREEWAHERSGGVEL